MDSWNFIQAALFSNYLGAQKTMDTSFWLRMEEKLLENLYFDNKSGHLIPVFLEGFISRDFDISFNLLSSYLLFLQQNHKKLYGNTLAHITKCLIQMKKHYKDERLTEDYKKISNFLVEKSKNNLPLLDFQGLANLSMILRLEDQLTDKFCSYVEAEVSAGLQIEKRQVYQLYQAWQPSSKGSINFWSDLTGFVLEESVKEGGKDLNEVLEFVESVGFLEEESKKKIEGIVGEVAEKIEIAYFMNLVEKVGKMELKDGEMWGKLEKRVEEFWKYFDGKEKEALRKVFGDKGKMEFWRA